MKQITKTATVDLGVSNEDYYNSIIQLLSSQKSNTDLQDEVCILFIINQQLNLYSIIIILNQFTYVNFYK